MLSTEEIGGIAGIVTAVGVILIPLGLAIILMIYLLKRGPKR